MLTFNSINIHNLDSHTFELSEKIMMSLNPFSILINVCFFIILYAAIPLAQAQSPLRIVSVDGNATEILLALGQAENIVAADLTSQPLLDNEVENLGYHRSLSAEGILTARPDLVIGSNHMGPATTLSILKKTDIDLLQLQSPESTSQLIDNIIIISKKLNAQVTAKPLIQRLRLRADALKNKIPTKPPSMVFLLDVGDRGLSQAGIDSTGDALIRLLGGNNISQFSGYKSISVEALLASNPDIILVGSRADTVDNAEKLLARLPVLQSSLAAQNHHVVSVNAATLIAGLSIGALAEAEHLAQRLYP